MANKDLLERLHADAKRHRVPQSEILPAWVKSVEQSASLAEPTVSHAKKEAAKKPEKARKSEKKSKKKKK